MRLSVPGSILLVGEYAILEEGGMGLAMAVQTRVRVSVEPARSLAIRCSWPGAALSWQGARPGADPLLSAIVGAVEEWLRERMPSGSLPCVAVSIDSSALFRPDGEKAGLGSSAAAAAGLTSALLYAAGAGKEVVKEASATVAVRAHRAAQGGVGSGYDVLCSIHGGLGVFRGGEVPSWTPCRLSWSPAVFLFHGRHPVRTPAAVQAYAAWKRANPAAALRYLETSNDAVQAFVGARSRDEALQRLASCRQLARELGEAIGVSARIDVPPGLDAAWCKALGAGNELGACLLAEESGQQSAFRAPLSEEGIVWEP
jgi:phosphomevalonate kinase